MSFLCGAGVQHQHHPEQKAVEMDQAHPTQSADQHHPPSVGLELPEEAEKKKASSDEEKNSAGKNVYSCSLTLRVPRVSTARFITVLNNHDRK